MIKKNKSESICNRNLSFKTLVHIQLYYNSLKQFFNNKKKNFINQFIRIFNIIFKNIELMVHL